MRNVAGIGAVGLVLAIGLTPACATKTYVRRSIADVDGKVSSLSRTVEETQERTRANESKIGAVDQKTAAAQAAADSARQAADQADARAGKADARAAALDLALRRLVFTVVLSEDQSNFAFGAAALPDEARARLDEMVTRIKAEPQAVYLEIEGHTDAVGPKPFNDRLGLERAEAVRRYLYEQYRIPLHKMNVISYGSQKPIAPNTTKAGRAANRRVVIKILA